MDKVKKMRTLVEAYQKSGMGPTQFAIKQGVSLDQLRYWVKKFKQEASPNPGFIELTPKQVTLRPSHSATHSLELIYPYGVLLKLSASDTSFLSQLINLY